MWQPHTKVNTQKGETCSESWWTLLWCLWHPPYLPGWFPFGFSLFSALEVPRGDRTLKDSQWSVVNHERAPSQELERDRYPHCTGNCPGGEDLSHLCLRAREARCAQRSHSSLRPYPPSCSLACVCWAVSVVLLFREGPLQDQGEHRV